MKKTLTAIIIGFALFGCTDKKNNEKAQEKALLDSIINVHDKVMEEDGHIMNNKMQLDTLINDKSIPNVKGTLNEYKQSLTEADNKMDSWMHKFDPDYKGKSHIEIMNYFHDQKKQIIAIDSDFKVQIKESNQAIVEYKKYTRK